MKLDRLVLILALAAAAGCEKDAASKGSGKLSASETSLLSDLPKGNTALFGGNYMKFQKYLQTSPLAGMISMLDKSSPGLSEWTNCFVEVPSLTMMGGVKVIGRSVELRFVMKGLDIATIEKCAKKAGFPATVDPDGKFIGFEMPSAMGPIHGGYLVLPDGALLTRQAMPTGFPATAPPPVDRASLEADRQSLTSGTAAQDTALISELDSVDRSKAMWFVGSAAGTPLSDKLGTVRGTIDLANGLSFDVTAQVTDAALADKIASGVPEMKKQAKSLPGELGSIVESLQFERSGDKLRFGIKIDNAQLAAVTRQLAPMMAGGLRQ